ncbi:MAG TPA: FAD binding domain-containing protein [Actinomycetota bacterium]|nr:FAD binding domain-containing protein [Actinomycetota bacterium]
MAPGTVTEAMRLKAEWPEATLVAGGTFVGILVRQGLLASEDWISLQNVAELRELSTGAELALGAMVTHRRVEQDPDVAAGWPGVRQVFAAVASPRVRNAATVGGMLGDADYASDPPAMLIALDAWVEALSVRGLRRIPVAELIVGHYQTSLEEDELITRVLVPRGRHLVVYRKLRTRSREDRPCVAVAASLHQGRVSVVVGAVAERPQRFPDLCATWDPGDGASAREIAAGYADRIDPIGDSRGSAAYRTRMIAVEVRRALDTLTPAALTSQAAGR